MKPEFLIGRTYLGWMGPIPDKSYPYVETILGVRNHRPDLYVAELIVFGKRGITTVGIRCETKGFKSLQDWYDRKTVQWLE